MIAHPPRLACVKHAASVRPEPGSNSPRVLIRLIRTGIATFVAVCPNHFLCTSVELSPEPDRSFRFDESASHFHSRSIQLSNSEFNQKSAGLRQPTILTRPAPRSQVVASNCLDQLASAQLTYWSEYPRLQGTPILATSIAIARGENLTELQIFN